MTATPSQIGTKIEHKLFFSNFSGTSGISRQDPGISRQKSVVSLASRDIPNFSAPTPSRGRPPPHPKISGPKSLGLVSFFFPDRKPLLGGPEGNLVDISAPKKKYLAPPPSPRHPPTPLLGNPTPPLFPNKKTTHPFRLELLLSFPTPETEGKIKNIRNVRQGKGDRCFFFVLGGSLGILRFPAGPRGPCHS